MSIVSIVGTGARVYVGTGARVYVGTGARVYVGTGARVYVGTGARVYVGTGAGGCFVICATSPFTDGTRIKREIIPAAKIAIITAIIPILIISLIIFSLFKIYPLSQF
jgi:hypothetical protein